MGLLGCETTDPDCGKEPTPARSRTAHPAPVTTAAKAAGVARRFVLAQDWGHLLDLDSLRVFLEDSSRWAVGIPWIDDGVMPGMTILTVDKDSGWVRVIPLE
jgi:hypothetical protein